MNTKFGVSLSAHLVSLSVIPNSCVTKHLLDRCEYSEVGNKSSSTCEGNFARSGKDHEINAVTSKVSESKLKNTKWGQVVAGGLRVLVVEVVGGKRLTPVGPGPSMILS